MFCDNHPKRIATISCLKCGKTICQECQVIIKGGDYCPDCAQLPMPGIKLNENLRNPWIAAGLSLVLPGFGQIYNGQMGKGFFIFLTSWLVAPWLYGIWDAFRMAFLINQGRVENNSSVVNLAGCFLMAVLLFWGPWVVWKIFPQEIFRLGKIYYLVKMKNNLEKISSAAELYRDMNGKYPDHYRDLYFSSSVSLDKLLCQVTIGGFHYYCQFSADGYSVSAVPQDDQNKDLGIFVVTTGGMLSPDIPVLSWPF